MRTESLTAAGHGFGLRVYPCDRPAGPLLVWAHGGAFMFGDPDMPEAHWVATELSRRGVVVLSPDYTLAPLDELASLPAPEDGGEHDLPPVDLAPDRPRAQYPVASLQLVAAFDWARRNAADLGADPGLVSIGGASAGGNLAAGAAFRLRDRGRERPAGLVLAYPVLHHTLPPPDDELRPLVPALPELLRFEPAAMRVMTAAYTADVHDAYAFPGGHDPHGLPATLVVTSDVDPLRMSGQAFAADLAAAGVDVGLVREPDTRHGHLNEPDNPAALRSVERIATWLAS